MKIQTQILGPSLVQWSPSRVMTGISLLEMHLELVLWMAGLDLTLFVVSSWKNISDGNGVLLFGKSILCFKKSHCLNKSILFQV